jgi:hypothetical protein
VDFQSANFVALEKNGDPTIGNDTTPDVTASGESGETPADQRYSVHRMGSGSWLRISHRSSADSSRILRRLFSSRAEQQYGYLEGSKPCEDALHHTYPAADSRVPELYARLAVGGWNVGTCLRGTG